MALIKYMGSADRRILEVGEDFDGRLSTPLEREVEWNWANHHVVDTSEVGLSDAAVSLLATELLPDGNPQFVDVTDYEVRPTNLAEQIWQGKPAHEGVRKGETSTEEADESEKNDGQAADPNPAPVVEEVAPDVPSGTRTSGRRGGSFATGGAVGGSTPGD